MQDTQVFAGIDDKLRSYVVIKIGNQQDLQTAIDKMLKAKKMDPQKPLLD